MNRTDEKDVNLMSKNEKTLIDRTKKGDKNAFEGLLLLNEKKVYNLVYRMTGNREDAFDIAQEAFMKAYNNLDSFKEESSFSTWVYRIAANVAIDFLRKRDKISTTAFYTVMNDGQDEVEIQLVDKNQTPEQAYEVVEFNELLQKAMDKLPADQKTIIILRDISGLSYEEISNIILVNMGTVKSRISRAREKLREILLSNGNFPQSTSSEINKEVRLK